MGQNPGTPGHINPFHDTGFAHTVAHATGRCTKEEAQGQVARPMWDLCPVEICILVADFLVLLHLLTYYILTTDIPKYFSSRESH